ncbi:MAG: chromate transporter [Erysipelotrichaceae bacterium]|nr:chromate transporter [Erysipelotrichaceae bacterium]
MKIYLELFWAFFQIGALTFGGGYAMLPMIQKEIVEKHHWATDDEIIDYFAIGQLTPGVIAVNTATFVGYKTKGILGGIIATLGVVTPSVMIITIIAAFLKNFMDYEIVQHAFGGIRVAVCVLISIAIMKLAKKNIKNNTGIIIAVLVFLLVTFTNISSVYVIVGAIIFGLLWKGGKQA